MVCSLQAESPDILLWSSSAHLFGHLLGNWEGEGVIIGIATAPPLKII